MVKIRSVFRLILAVYFMALYFTKRIFCFTVDKQASASGGLRPPTPVLVLPRLWALLLDPLWGFCPPDPLLCSTEPWRQIDAYASTGNVGQVVMESIAYDKVPWTASCLALYHLTFVKILIKFRSLWNATCQQNHCVIVQLMVALIQILGGVQVATCNGFTTAWSPQRNILNQCIEWSPNFHFLPRDAMLARYMT